MATPVKIIVNGRKATSSVKVAKPYKNDKNYSYNKEIERILVERSKKEKNL